MGADMSQYQPVGTATCLMCHGDRAALIKRTEHLNKVVKEKNPVTGHIETVTKDINPHSGHHDRGRLDCFECHREHKASINLCAQCHDVAALDGTRTLSGETTCATWARSL